MGIEYSLPHSKVVEKTKPDDTSPEAMLALAEKNYEEANKPPFEFTPRKLSEIEEEMIINTIKYYEGNVPKIAESLGVSTKTVYNKVDALGINLDEFRNIQP